MGIVPKQPDGSFGNPDLSMAQRDATTVPQQTLFVLKKSLRHGSSVYHAEPAPPSKGSMKKRSGFATFINVSINAIPPRKKLNGGFVSSRARRLDRAQGHRSRSSR